MVLYSSSVEFTRNLSPDVTLHLHRQGNFVYVAAAKKYKSVLGELGFAHQGLQLVSIATVRGIQPVGSRGGGGGCRAYPIAPAVSVISNEASALACVGKEAMARL